MDTPQLRLVPGTRVRLASCVSDIPLPPDGSLVLCDLDDTVIYTHFRHSSHKWTQPSLVRLFHPNDAQWCHRVHASCTLIYITARDPAMSDTTYDHLRRLGLPMNRVVFSDNKGAAVAELIAAYPSAPVVLFIDDLDRHLRSVAASAPAVQCYRIDPCLYKKFEARARRRDKQMR
jgi:hypothetical protein